MLAMAIDWSFAWPACVGKWQWQLAAVNVVAVLIGAAGMAAAARLRRATAPGVGLQYFRATVIMLLNGLFSLLILAQALPILLTWGCG
jgi:hypothetical protein